MGRVVREVEMARNWFRGIFAIFLTKMFAEAVCTISAR